jgi:hypothetical protein
VGSHGRTEGRGGRTRRKCRQTNNKPYAIVNIHKISRPLDWQEGDQVGNGTREFQWTCPTRTMESIGPQWHLERRSKGEEDVAAIN